MQQPTYSSVNTTTRQHSGRRVPALVALLVTALVLPSSYFVASAGAHVVQAEQMQVQNAASPQPGFGPQGTARLINGRTITPAGKQSRLGDLPLNAILSPDGTHLLVSNSGAGEQSLQVVDTGTGGVVQTIPYTAPNGVFVGLAYSPGGTRAYASGGGSNVIHTFNVDPTGMLSPAGDIDLSSVGPGGTPLGNGPWPAGLSLSPDGNTLYVADNLANAVSVVPVSTISATTPATVPVSATTATTIPVGSYPYTTLATPDGRKVYVSNWGDGTISVIDTVSNTVATTISVGVSSTVGISGVVTPATTHPSAMALAANGLLYVSLSNADAIAVIDTATDTLLRTISDAPYKNAPLSSSPQGLAVSPNGRFLYVANAGTDDVTVFGLFGPAIPEHRLGRIPTGWYPTSVTLSDNGQVLYVTNGKGRGAGPNDSYLSPNPTRLNPPIANAASGYNDGYCNCNFDQYTGSMILGTLSTIPAPSLGLLALYTREVQIDNREGTITINKRPADSPIPLPGGVSPIKHVIYIIKENRTYDQVFGDKTTGDGDASLTLFPQANTPNLHALTQRFGLLDNTYADAEVSADGHNWSMSANATDYNEKMWPQDYSPGAGRNRGYDFEGGTTINLSPGGYLWDVAAKAGITFRDYGEFVNNSGSPITITAGSPCPGPAATSYVGYTVPAGSVLCFGATMPNTTTTPNLVGHVDPNFRSFDSRYSDLDRVAEWQREFNQQIVSDTVPQLTILRLPNDHTAGTRAGYPTPQNYVAQNDLAVGQVVDIVSHSSIWSSTAIFVIEDDAQNGPDHIDAHRTEALVISPYTSRTYPFVDHTLYDTAAMLRTIELILGLRPMSQYDANAQPMMGMFTGNADITPYTAISPTISLSATNTLQSYGAMESAQIDFKREDQAPMSELNHILWHAIKGANTPYPALPQAGTVPKASDPD